MALFFYAFLSWYTFCHTVYRTKERRMEFEADAPSQMSLGDLRPGSISFTKAFDPPPVPRMRIAITDGSTAGIAKNKFPKDSKDRITPASHIRARRLEKMRGVKLRLMN